VVATQEGRNPPLQTLHVVEAFDVRWGQREGSVGAHPAPESPKPWSQITSAGEEEDIVTDALLSLREVVRTALEWQRLGRKRAKEGVNRATAVHINQILRHIGSQRTHRIQDGQIRVEATPGWRRRGGRPVSPDASSVETPRPR
jgi:hypothetical protein